ncbi:MAG: hypothetical protein ABID04_02065 [Patescibacteria group bacterium]
MTIQPSSLFKAVFLIFLTLMVTTKTTDADLFDREVITGNSYRASTLDFSTRDTANESPVSFLFNVTGLIPSGFQGKAVRIKKDGLMDFNYRVSVNKTAGDDDVFQALKVWLMHDWQVQQQTNLADFVADSEVDETGKDDLVLFVGLENNDLSLANKSCDFNLVFRSWRQSPGESSGFVDEEVLANHISSGSWVVE